MTLNLATWRLLAGSLILLTAACTAPSPAPGPDQASASDAKEITWTDGQPAISLSCASSGGCQQRAIAMCTKGSYKILKSENLPSAGNFLERRGPATAVIRCT